MAGPLERITFAFDLSNPRPPATMAAILIAASRVFPAGHECTAAAFSVQTEGIEAFAHARKSCSGEYFGAGALGFERENQ